MSQVSTVCSTATECCFSGTSERPDPWRGSFEAPADPLRRTAHATCSRWSWAHRLAWQCCLSLLQPPRLPVAHPGQASRSRPDGDRERAAPVSAHGQANDGGPLPSELRATRRRLPSSGRTWSGCLGLLLRGRPPNTRLMTSRCVFLAEAVSEAPRHRSGRRIGPSLGVAGRMVVATRIGCCRGWRGSGYRAMRARWGAATPGPSNLARV